MMLPQVGQGALAVECRADDERHARPLAAIDDRGRPPLVAAERAFLAELGGGCTLPVGAHATWADGRAPARAGRRGPTIRLTGMMASADGAGGAPSHRGRATVPTTSGGRWPGTCSTTPADGDLGEWDPSLGPAPGTVASTG